MIPSPPGAGRRPVCARAAASFFDGVGPPPRRAHVRRARAGDAGRLARRMRDADRWELAALGRAPAEALAEAAALSRTPYSAVDAEGRLMLMFGVAPAPLSEAWTAGAGRRLRIGAPWMLAAPELETIARPFLRACRGWADHLAAPYDLLANCVDERNAAHIRWLGWSGFTFLRRVPIGPERRPFLEFVRLGRRAAATSPKRSAKERTHV